MKRFKISALLLLIAVVLVGCKDEKKEWSNFYGYANDDIIGQYSFSNIPKVFDDLEPSEYCYISEDAEIKITGASSTTVKFNIKCPNDNPEIEFSREFVGRPAKIHNDFMVKMSSGYYSIGNDRLRAYNVTASVLRNDMQQIRLHGFAAINTYKIVTVPSTTPGLPPLTDTVQDSGVNYYFDVIKD